MMNLWWISLTFLPPQCWMLLCVCPSSQAGVWREVWYSDSTPNCNSPREAWGEKNRKSLCIDCHVSVTAKLMCGLTNILSSYFPSHPVVCLWIIVLNFQAICKIGKQCIVKDLTTFLFAYTGQQVDSISGNIFPFLLVFMLLKIMEYAIKNIYLLLPCWM